MLVTDGGIHTKAQQPSTYISTFEGSTFRSRKFFATFSQNFRQFFAEVTATFSSSSCCVLAKLVVEKKANISQKSGENTKNHDPPG
jgi:hypothetical protein